MQNDTGKRNKKKLFLILGISAVLLLSFVAAYYMFYYNSSTNYTIRGGEGELLVVTTDLSDQLFNVNETDLISQPLVINNIGGVGIDMLYGIDIAYTGLDPLCPGGESDLTIWMENFDGEMIDGELFRMNGNSNLFTLFASVDPIVGDRTCPADIIVTITMSE